MKAIELNNLNDNQFLLYMEVITEIRKKYAEKEYVLDYDWNEYRDYYFRDNTDPKEFKERRLNVIKDGGKNSLSEFIFFDDDNPVSFIACKKLSGDRCEFIYDSVYSEAPDTLLKEIYKILELYLEKIKIESISYLANRKSDRVSFENAGFKIDYDVFNSKLLRKDIDFENLKRIVECNEHVKDFDLKLYRDVPEDISNVYVDFMNDALPAKDFFNPVKQEFEKYTKEDFLSRIRNDREDGDPMYLYVLFDKDNIAAHCKVYLEIEDEKFFIQHCGALTGVAEKYRGKGFGKYLKAKMYLKIAEDHPDFSHAITDTYPWNKYMYKINEELGFKVYNEGCIFRFTKSDLEGLLK
ncbi:MAG: GNAT family N-acetyltransferase [Ignavibacteria bacterium]|nr:GNAT family N-acetyltransferase [Ignavibacteria bacterium]